jgi:hypothetical protein
VEKNCGEFYNYKKMKLPYFEELVEEIAKKIHLCLLWIE